mmetsp:Transcript_43929/g.116107  ORF Transcript_43929/g.116107 Transcript_43929/m.116107 type:complete len:83 (+) Transcript_43929:2022-2270(+)
MEVWLSTIRKNTTTAEAKHVSLSKGRECCRCVIDLSSAALGTPDWIRAASDGYLHQVRVRDCWGVPTSPTVLNWFGNDGIEH